MSNENKELLSHPKFLTSEQCELLNMHTGVILLQMLKGRLLNTIESCGMPDKQEEAVKRTVTDQLYQSQNDFSSIIYELKI